MKQFRLSRYVALSCAAALLTLSPFTLRSADADKPNKAAKPATPASSDKAAGEDKAKPQIDPKADEILKKMSEGFKSAKGVRVDMKMNMKMKMSGMNQEMPSEYSMVAERPNKMAMRMTGQGMGATMVSDGKKLYVHVPMLNRYTETDAPANIEDVGEKSGTPSGAHDLLTGGLLSSDPYATLLKDAQKVAYVGLEKEEGKDLHHLKVTQEDVEWDMFIEGGANPTIKRIAADMTKAIAQSLPEEARKDVSMTMTINYSKWDLAAKTTADDFKFTPPAGAEKVDSFAGPQAPAGDDEDDEGKPSPLLGKPAPKLDIELLDGGQLSLAKHKGKEVVILDFWATWCGPCVRAMPILSEVAKSYKDKGVVLYAVNVQEDAKAIKAFLAKKELAVTVALDKEGAVSERYGVEGIPQTVIIDKEGNVRAVHVGFSPDLKDILKKDLDPLVK